MSPPPIQTHFDVLYYFRGKGNIFWEKPKEITKDYFFPSGMTHSNISISRRKPLSDALCCLLNAVSLFIKYLFGLWKFHSVYTHIHLSISLWKCNKCCLSSLMAEGLSFLPPQIPTPHSFTHMQSPLQPSCTSFPNHHQNLIWLR